MVDVVLALEELDELAQRHGGRTSKVASRRLRRGVGGVVGGAAPHEPPLAAEAAVPGRRRPNFEKNTPQFKPLFLGGHRGISRILERIPSIIEHVGSISE